jgi:hypothetical protein
MHTLHNEMAIQKNLLFFVMNVFWYAGYAKMRCWGMLLSCNVQSPIDMKRVWWAVHYGPRREGRKEGREEKAAYKSTRIA